MFSSAERTRGSFIRWSIWNYFWLAWDVFWGLVAGREGEWLWAAFFFVFAAGMAFFQVANVQARERAIKRENREAALGQGLDDDRPL